MRPREALDLIGLRPPRPRRGWLLERCYEISDLRRLAMLTTPRPVFDYVDGGADEELTLQRNQDAYRAWHLVPAGIRDVSTIDTSTTLFGQRLSLPLACAPTGVSRVVHAAGEVGVARAAAAAGVAYTLSMDASTGVEELAAAANGELWFELLIERDREHSAQLLKRAWGAGFRVLVICIDAAVAGFRIRDFRNGMTYPPQLTLHTLSSIALKPKYWIDVLRNPPITFANLSGAGGNAAPTVAEVTEILDPTVGWDDVATFSELWPGPVLIKGPLDAAGAVRAMQAGADGIYLSNLGGRQLDREIPPLELLPEVRGAIGEQATIVIDSGIRHGNDLVVALALGADAGAIGRAYLYGLMAGGELGVARVFELFTEQFERALGLLGVTSVAELREQGPRLLRRRP